MATLRTGTRLRTCTILEPLGGFVLTLGTVLSVAAFGARTACAEPPTPRGDYQWLDVRGQPLPFQDNAAIQDAMRSARVVDRETIGHGVLAAEKLLLEGADARFHAAFRMADVKLREPSATGRKRAKKFRDAAIFECAAYEVSQLLGMGRIPPVVERRIGAQDGTLQIWAEDTRTERGLREQKRLRPPDLERWDQQRQIMYAFDSLIGNFDRNEGNVLLDRSWNMWFIDHTRAFEPSSKLLNRDRLKACERGFWNSLREMDEDVLRRRLENILERREIANLVSRRLKLISHIQELIDEHGEEAVLFDLRPAAAEKADWND